MPLLLFFLSLVTIAAGGVLAILLWRRPAVMKAAAVLLIGAGCLLGLIDAGARLSRSGPFTAACGTLGSLTLTFRIDALSAFFLTAIFAVCLLAALYSFNYLDHAAKPLRTGVHYFFFAMLIGAMALVVAADNLITFMLSWELMSLASFILVIHDDEDAGNRRAGYLYLVFSQSGAMFILAAFGVMFAHSDSLDFSAAAGLPEAAKILVFVLAFIGFGSKAGVFPFHPWLPHAHPAAPSPVSAVMSGVMIKTGIYGILRIYALLDWRTPLFGEIVLIAGVVSGVLGVVYALGQHDLKRLLAYHSVENIGIILIGLGLGMIGAAAGQPVMAVLGFAGGLLHVLNHAVFKALLFMGAGMVLHATGTRTIDALGGLLRRMKITGTTFLIGSLAISGLPPLNGFVSEFLIYLGGFRGLALDKSAFALCVVAIVGLAVIGGLALACFTKVVGVVFQGEARSRAAQTAHEKGPAMLAAMLVLAAACVAIGVFPGFFLPLALAAVSALGPGFADVALGPFLQLAANITLAAAIIGGMILLVFALRLFLYRGKHVARAGTWGCGFTQPTARMQYTGSSYAASILEFFRPAAPFWEDHPPIEGRFPKETHYHSRIEDIAERWQEPALVRPVLGIFDRLRWLQHGDIHLYIGYILLAIVVLLFFV
jgi:hydrogenase-4 component B